jgi:hypothetical protein
MKKLTASDISMFRTPNLGEQIKVNHSRCSAGVDTKQRLYIKRVHGGILAYCHHCSLGGFFPSKDKSGKDLAKWLASDSTELPTKTSEDIRTCYSNVIEDGRNNPNNGTSKWLIKYNFNISDFNYDFTGRLVLPIANYNKELVGYQIRNIDSSPKYVTTISDEHKHTFGGCWASSRIPTNNVFITEDILSSYKLQSTANKVNIPIKTLALLGTKLSYTDETILRENKHNAIVWLDNDKAGISAASRIIDRLSFLGIRSMWVSEVDEPKKVSEETIVFFLRKFHGL